MNISWKHSAAVALLAQLVVATPTVMAADLTGTWNGQMRCKYVTDGGWTYTEVYKASTLKVQDDPGNFRLVSDVGYFANSLFPYPFLGVEFSPLYQDVDKPEKSFAYITLCPFFYPGAAGQESGLLSFVTNTARGTSKLVGTTHGWFVGFEIGPLALTCTWKFERVNTVNPHVSADCPETE